MDFLTCRLGSTEGTPPLLRWDKTLHHLFLIGLRRISHELRPPAGLGY
ncbi:unnamed protein product, partial [Gulo gulo]